MTPYRAPRWLPGGHLQTLYAALLAPRAQVAFQRERWDTPDGDFIDLDWTDPARGRNNGNPLVVLFHGLEGGSTSPYATALMATAVARGWVGVVVHFRGCGGELNRLPRAYHSGDSAEINWILRRLKSETGASLHAAGVSLGGNALLKWLGEQEMAAKSVIDAAAAISAPVDLMIAGDALGKGFNRIYTWNFLTTMRHKTLAKLVLFPDLCDRNRVLAARTLRDFDDIVTAPLHGYRDTDDYWTRASAKPLLRRIAVPTLMINARNDPFLPAAALPDAHELSTAVTVEFPATGGHVGFVSGGFPGNLDWLPQRLLKFFQAHATA
ncbi:MAG: hydrolase [Betaproteobacteria bacterium]|nr:hydrolase [Betaproteobacteria bacterium]